MVLSAQERYLRTLSEDDWAASVLEVARLHRYVWYHTHDSRRSDAGFPDYVFSRAGDLFVAELKKETGVATPAQLDWLQRFRDAGHDAYLWRPRDQAEMLARFGLHPAVTIVGYGENDQHPRQVHPIPDPSGYS